MAITVQDIINLLDKKYRDPSDGTIDDNNKMIAIQEISDDLKGHIFPWDIRTNYLKYYDTLTRYAAPSDFYAFVEPEPENRLYSMNLVSPEDFNVLDKKGDNEIYAAEYRNGELGFRIKTARRQRAIDIAMLNSHTGEGAITVVGTAANLRTDVNVFRHNSSSIAFDFTPSGAGTAGINITGLSAVDLSDHGITSGDILSVYFPSSPANITGFTIRHGSDSNNYYSLQITTQADGRIFEAGWNDFLFNLEDSAETGTVDDSSISYTRLFFNYSASQVAMYGVRFNWLRNAPSLILPIQYGTYHCAKNANGTYISIINDITDVMLFSVLYPPLRDLYVYGATSVLNDNSMESDDFVNKDAIYQRKKQKLFELFPSRMKQARRGTDLYVDPLYF